MIVHNQKKGGNMLKKKSRFLKICSIFLLLCLVSIPLESVFSRLYDHRFGCARIGWSAGLFGCLGESWCASYREDGGVWTGSCTMDCYIGSEHTGHAVCQYVPLMR